MTHEEIHDLLEQWAKTHSVRFVSRSSGQYSTDIISRDSLYELIQLASGSKEDPKEETEQQRLNLQAKQPKECPSCGCTKFTGAGMRTADNHSAWQDADGTWYDGPASETFTLQCANDCGWIKKVHKVRGKVVAVTEFDPAAPDVSAKPPSV